MTAFEEKIEEAARRTDPRTARMVWWYAETLDPYGQGGLKPEEHQVGREYFLVDPEAKFPVLVYDVHQLHPDIPDAEWNELMRAAAARDDSFDPLPFFHAHRRGRDQQWSAPVARSRLGRDGQTRQRDPKWGRQHPEGRGRVRQ